jgi:hypothetical protein
LALPSERPGATPEAEAEATEAGPGPGSAAGAEQWPEPDLPPALQTRAEPDPGHPVPASTAAADQPAAARPQPVAAKRPRGGQHAARHGKPARRSRGPALENLDLVPADEDAGSSPRVSHEETGDWS